MNRIRKVFSFIHLSCWLLGFVLLCWIFSSEGHSNWLYLSTFVLLSALFSFYSHFFILTRYLNRKKVGVYLLGLVLILLVAPFPYLAVEGISIDNGPDFLDHYFTTMISFVLICIIFSSIARTTENWFLNTFKREALEKQSIQAELNYLKSQINPHFLFNTLNNIHTLSYKQSPSTPEAIMRLSSLMRYMLYESNADAVPLTRELEYLQDFISLQQLRYRKSPIVDLKVDGDPATCFVAPLLFVHMLENAYKHSPAQMEPGDIKVAIVLKANSLTFSIENPVGNKTRKAFGEVGGIGLVNLKKRLQLLYPDQHNFEIDASVSFFKVVLKLHHRHLQDHERKAEMLYSGG